jgi:hypothetical protein
MAKVIRLTEADLYRIVKRVMTESGMAAEQGLSDEQKEMIKDSLNRRDLRVLKMMLDKYGETQLKDMMIDVANEIVSGGGVGAEKPGRPDMDDSEQMASMTEGEDMSDEEIQRDKQKLSQILQKVFMGGLLATFVSYGMGMEVVGIVTYIISMISLGKLFNIHDN